MMQSCGALDRRAIGAAAPVRPQTRRIAFGVGGEKRSQQRLRRSLRLPGARGRENPERRPQESDMNHDHIVAEDFGA
jgi:hypothetical protein